MTRCKGEPLPLPLPPYVSYHQRYILISILILFLSEGQVGEAWEPSNKAMSFRISGSTGQNSPFTLFLFSECEQFSILQFQYMDEILSNCP
jgi:hypothetical protein